MIRNAVSILRNRGLLTLLTAIYWELKALWYRRLRGERYIERRVHDHRMLLDLDDPGISRTLLLFGTRELEHKILLERVLDRGMTVLDIGANIGYYALMELRLVGSGGRLIAVEPSPSNIALLRRNLELNGYVDVDVRQVAVSDRVGTATFHMAEMSNLNTFHASGTAVKHLTGRSIEVATTTVTDLMRDVGNVDLIRMDVEGHEVEVMSGMIDAVERGEIAPMVLFETHLSRYSGGHDLEPVLRKLFAGGYRVRYLASSSARGTDLIRERGYGGGEPIRTDDVERVIFEHISDDDAVDLVCNVGGARTVLLEKRS